MTNLPSYEGVNQPFIDVIKHVNETMADYLRVYTNFTKLGPDYSLMSRLEAHENLVLHRLHKNFAHVTVEEAEERRSRTIKQMIDYDTAGIQNFPKLLNSKVVDPSVRHVLYNARKSLHEALTHYRFSNSTLSLPSGETYVSASGDVSFYAKIRDRKQWCCTPDCFDLFARICYNSGALKFAARRHFKDYERESKRTFANKAMWVAAKEQGIKNARFAIFKAKLKCIITFVPGARVTTVPKDLVVDRVIECDAFCNMCCQLTIDGSIKKMIQEYWGIDLLQSQTIHQLMLRDDRNSTIDFSNASNSTWLSVVEWFFQGTTFFKHLVQTRCGLVEIRNYEDEDFYFHHLNMLSPMGNGYTFSVMTLILLAVGRELDDFCHVYGDDVIIDNDVAPLALETYNFIGYKVNATKTFLDSPFRESCGGFFHSGYLTSFEIEWCEDIVDAIVLCNKIAILAQQDLPNLHLDELHTQLIKDIPCHLFKGYKPPVNWATLRMLENSRSITSESDNRKALFLRATGLSYFKVNSYVAPLPSLDDGVWVGVRKVVRLQKEDSKCQTAYKRLRGELSKDYAIPESNIRIQPYLHISRVAQRYRSKNGRPMQPTKDVSRLLAWHYVYTGRVAAPTLRKTELKMSWNHTYV